MKTRLTLLGTYRMPQKAVICLCFPLFFSLFLKAETVLNISSVRVSKDYPASFVLDLYSNDLVKIDYSKISGKGNFEDLIVKVVDLNLQEPETLKEMDRSGRTFIAPYDGKYRIDFIYRGKGGIRLIRERYIELKINISNDGYFELEDGETREILHATNCVIDEGRDKSFSLSYFLTEGDRITVGCDDPKSAFLQLYVPQLGKNFSIGSSKTIEISREGYYLFQFYLQEGEGISLLNFRELLKDADILFQDLSIYREKAISFDPASTLSSFGEEDTDEDTGEGQDEDNGFEQDFLDIQQMMENSNKSSAETTKMIAEMMMEMQKRQEELLNKKNINIEVYANPFDESMLLEPELNFAVQNGNRQCRELSLFSTDYDLWFYWVGVGENAESAFEEHNDKITNSFRESFGDAYAQYIYFKNAPAEHATKRRREPPFPDEDEYSHYLNEDIEYAIVDYRNKIRFENGERYRKMNASKKKAKYITSDYGLSRKPVSADNPLYFCAANNNKATAVNVFFKYFLIQYEQEEY